MSGNIGHQQEKPKRSSNGDNMNAITVIEGVVKRTEEYGFSALAPSDKPGNFVGTYVKKDGELNVRKKGGMELIGGTSEDREKLARIHAENKVQVAVMFSDGSKKYKGTFERDDTLYDVKAEIEEEEGKLVSHFKYHDSEKEIGITTAVSSLEENVVAVLKGDP